MPRFHSFVVFAEMRTGSNLLEANLNALPGVSCLGEMFNPHFIGKKDQTEAFGIDLAAREQDPRALLRVWSAFEQPASRPEEHAAQLWLGAPDGRRWRRRGALTPPAQLIAQLREMGA